MLMRESLFLGLKKKNIDRRTEKFVGKKWKNVFKNR